MKLNWKKCLSNGFIILCIVGVFFIAFGNKEFENAWDAVSQLSPIWLLGVLGCWVIYVFFDATCYWMYLKSQNLRLSMPRAIHVSLVGFYYSNITPSSAGGQPMQINSLHKAGIPLGYGTMAATVRFICNQTATVSMALVFTLINYGFVHQQLGSLIWVVRLGWLINFLAIPAVLLAAFKRDWIQRLCERIIRLLVRICLVKHEEKAIASVTEMLDTYQVALRNLLNKPGQILLQLANSCISILGLIFTIFFVYHSFGLNEIPWHRLITIGFLLFISVSYTPLPGASGAQEGGFLVFYQGIFPSGIIGIALLVWRFFTYYLFLMIGVFSSIIDKILLKRKACSAEVNRQEPLSDSRPAGID